MSRWLHLCARGPRAAPRAPLLDRMFAIELKSPALRGPSAHVECDGRDVTFVKLQTPKLGQAAYVRATTGLAEVRPTSGGIKSRSEVSARVGVFC
ncbi:hypothetical protein EVAR_76634_1 [Eumeta japonica]|uniref:Uncharacterized protein n=1 Tax=Eumeta variegata TaxID=151549 RepID=A0A4C1T7Y4_EUMVA|nr:hypothetical protein EVAR_76634_1 [Eumeta japonica]